MGLTEPDAQSRGDVYKNMLNKKTGCIRVLMTKVTKYENHQIFTETVWSCTQVKPSNSNSNQFCFSKIGLKHFYVFINIHNQGKIISLNN